MLEQPEIVHRLQAGELDVARAVAGVSRGLPHAVRPTGQVKHSVPVRRALDFVLGQCEGRTHRLLQPGSKLHVVQPLEDLVVPHGVPGNLPPKEDRILEEDRAELGEEAEEAMRRPVISILFSLRIREIQGHGAVIPHPVLLKPCYRPQELPGNSWSGSPGFLSQYLRCWRRCGWRW